MGTQFSNTEHIYLYFLIDKLYLFYFLKGDAKKISNKRFTKYYSFANYFYFCILYEYLGTVGLSSLSGTEPGICLFTQSPPQPDEQREASCEVPRYECKFVFVFLT